MSTKAIPGTLGELANLVAPAHIFLPRTMLIPEEVKLLHFLGSQVYTGQGEIIDAGAFCGGSAYAFAAGLSENGAVTRKSKRIFSYDLFRCDEPYTRDFVQNVFYSRYDEFGRLLHPIRTVEMNESFLDVFLFQTQRYSEMITPKPGSFLDFSWDDRPIEILFIDVAKTLELQSHAFKTFGARMIPGRTILIQQDFHHMWHPYIHVAMEFLRPYFDIVVSAVGATRAYKLKHAISASDLQRVIDYDFTVEERRRLLRQTVDLAPPEEQPLLEMVLVRQAVVDGDQAVLRQTVQEAWNTYKHSNYANYVAGSVAQLCPGVEFGLE